MSYIPSSPRERRPRVSAEVRALRRERDRLADLDLQVRAARASALQRDPTGTWQLDKRIGLLEQKLRARLAAYHKPVLFFVRRRV